MEEGQDEDGPATVSLRKRVERREASAPRPGGGPAAAAGESGPVRRFRSGRRIPALITAAVGLACCVLLLYDTITVRAGGQASWWRRHFTHELATRPIENGWVIGIAAAIAVIGLWMLWMAVLPGARRWLPLRPPGDELRAAIHRSGAAVLVRDAMMRTAGVSAARVKVRGRRVKARADVHFRDPDEVREQLGRVIAETVAGVGLARRPRLKVTVRPVGVTASKLR